MCVQIFEVGSLKSIARATMGDGSLSQVHPSSMLGFTNSLVLTINGRRYQSAIP